MQKNKNCIFITKTLNLELNPTTLLNTSSGIFEYGLISEIKNKTTLSVIYLGEKDTKQKLIDGINYISINFKSMYGFFKLVKLLANKNTCETSTIITTGYYPVETLAIIISSKLYKYKSFSYVYDTHRTATSKMNKIKAALANTYFNIGFFLTKKNNGLLILNERFIEKLNINTPFYKTRIGINTYNNDFRITKTHSSISDKRKLLFAGTINNENGVGLLIDFFEKYKEHNFQIDFYGSGDMEDKVIKLSEIDGRIKYHGRIPNEYLIKKLIEADYLINLRDPDGLSADYSFPSKLINFMTTGTPVICNRFPGLDEKYEKYLILIDDYSIEKLSSKLLSLNENKYDINIGTSAIEFTKKNNNWGIVTEEVINFINKF